MRRANRLVLLVVVALVAGLAAAHGKKNGRRSPKAELRAILDHSRDNAEAAQRDANEAYRGVEKACGAAVEELMAEVRPAQKELISSMALIRKRAQTVRDNRRAVRSLNATIDLLGGRVETLGLRMAAAVEERRETHGLAAERVSDTRHLADSVAALMASVSNAHVRLNASSAEGGAGAAAPALLETGAAPAAALSTVSDSFKLLNLLRHELSEYAVQLPQHQSEAQLSFEKVYSHLNESYFHTREEYRKAVAARKHAIEENEYLVEWIARTRATLPDLRRQLRVLQRELRAEIKECEDARGEFKDDSADRRRELETLATVERIVAAQLTDADFLPPPPPTPKKEAKEVKEVVDPDLNKRVNNTDAAAPQQQKESTEKNIIYG